MEKFTYLKLFHLTPSRCWLISHIEQVDACHSNHKTPHCWHFNVRIEEERCRIFFPGCFFCFLLFGFYSLWAAIARLMCIYRGFLYYYYYFIIIFIYIFSPHITSEVEVAQSGWVLFKTLYSVVVQVLNMHPTKELTRLPKPKAVLSFIIVRAN